MNILVDLANVPPIPIPLGKDEQNAFNTVIFDARAWGADFPGATYTVLYQRPTGDIYPVLVNQPGPLISWTPSAADTTIVPNAPAFARAEIRLMQGDALGKSATAVFGLTAGILSEAPAAPTPDWVTTVAQDAAKAEAAVAHYPHLTDGDLWIWNPTSEQWEKLIISEGGNPNAVLFTAQTLTTAQQAQARYNIGAKIPLYLAYDSTTQTVNLTPSEIEALSAAGYDVHLRMTNGIFIYDLRYVGFSASLQVAALAAECNGTSAYAFVHADKSAALAVNHVGDRLQTVENDVAQLTDDKADKTDLDDVLRYSLMNLTDAQKAQARTNIGAASMADIGTVFTLKGGVATVADLPQTGNRIGDVWYVENLSAGFIWITSTAYPNGYWEELGETIDMSAYIEKPANPQTGYVITWNGSAWIAQAIPKELPAVTASDNGKFLRVVNGAWAAQTVPSAEGASF